MHNIEHSPKSMRLKVKQLMNSQCFTEVLRPSPCSEIYTMLITDDTTVLFYILFMGVLDVQYLDTQCVARFSKGTYTQLT
jgi:hypothetical protein